MSPKNKIPLLALLLTLIAAAPLPAAQAQTTEIALVPGTAAVGDSVAPALISALADASALFPDLPYFAVTDVRDMNAWLLVSVVGMEAYDAARGWQLEQDGAWFGLVLLKKDGGGNWRGAVQGTPAFSDLLAEVPNALITPQAKRDLDPLAPQDVIAQTTPHIFPWDSGTKMYYAQGIHANGFNAITGAPWVAVDMASDGNTAAGHAPNRLLAAAAGTISYKCTGPANVAIRIGNFFYTHLVNHPGLYVGASFNQGGVLGAMQTGAFSDSCGWANQSAGWFHVHWGFPNANLTVEGWTLNVATGVWSNGATTISPSDPYDRRWITASHDADCPQTGGAILYWNSGYNCANNTVDSGYRLQSAIGWQNLGGGTFDNQASSLKVPAGWSVMLYEGANRTGASVCYAADAANFALEGNFPGTSTPIDENVSSFAVYPNTACAAPAAPALLTPADGLVAPHNYSLTFQWEAVTGANEYQVEWWTGGGSPSQPCGWTTSTSCQVGAAAAGKTYSWRVRARNAAASGDWSETWTFTLLPPPPAAFSKVAPANAVIGQAPDLTLSWAASNGAARYEYCLDATSPYTCDDGVWTDNGTAVSAAITGLEHNATYGWQVRAVNAGGVSYANSGAWWLFKTRPAAPTLIAPAEGENALLQKPAFSWDPVAGAISYYIQISRNDLFTQLVVNTAVVAPSYTPAVNLPPGLTLYWRVQARGLTGWSLWSATRSFQSANPPSIPALLSPPYNSLTTDYTPRFDWAQVAVPAGTTFARYEIVVDDSADFSSPVHAAAVSGLAAHEYTLPDDAPLAPNTVYYWRVRACNEENECSAWSTTFLLRAAIRPPDLLAPEDAAAPLTLRPTFDWDDPPGSSGYTIQFARDAAFTQLIRAFNVFPSTYTPNFDLPRSLVLYWRVQARGVNGPSAWSAPRSFTSPNPPYTPAPISPAFNAVTTDYTPRFDWAAAILPAGTTFGRYELEIDDAADFLTPVHTAALPDHAAHEYTLPDDAPLAPNTVYYWRVRACNANNECSVPSAAWILRAAILPPVLLQPEEAAAPLSLRPAFDWDDPPGATAYTIQFSTSSAFLAPFRTLNIIPSAYTPNFDLPKNAVVYWRVRALGPNGPSAWSTVRSLFTPNPPSIPVLLTPANYSLTTDYTPRLDWAAVIVPAGTTFDRYDLQVATDAAFTNLALSDLPGLTDVNLHEYTPEADLTPNTLYYWRVRAFNTLGQYSSWSSVRTFRTAILPPVLLSPADGAALAPLRPPLDWDDVAGASWYLVQVSKNPAFTTYVIYASATASTYTPTVNLPLDTPLYWRVRAFGANGPSLWSETRSFTVSSLAACPLFPADNIWNTRVDGLPVHARSEDWINSIGRNTGFHMDFGSGVWNGAPIGIPYNSANAATPRYAVTFYYPDESDPGPYPIPPNPRIEGGSDRHLLVVDASTCKLYEIYDLSNSGGRWYGGSGAVWDLTSNALRPAGWTSADAAGLPILPGLVRYEEVASGEIRHALRFTASRTDGYLWPARHHTSNTGNPSIPPMGARFRLKASFDISPFPPQMQVILTAMKRYGIILADNGSNWYVSGAPDPRWDNDMLHLLDALTGDDFEAVDTSGLMIDPNSGQAAQP